MVKSYKPTSAGRRFGSVTDYSVLSRVAPCKALLEKLPKTGGRNARGRITCRHRGGGNKRHYRRIDFKRQKDGIPARVSTLEYDPNRSAFIALLAYADGEKRYIIAPEGLKPGDTVVSGDKVPLKVGNTMPVSEIPVGIEIHNVELQAGRGGQLARSAGSSVQVQAKEGNYAHLKLPSGEIRKVRLECRATVGQTSNKEHNNVVIGKAGRKRHMGRRPHVRGVAMNPVAHPLGGGEGRSSGGRHPCSPWGQLAKGQKTRSKRKPSGSLILRRRKKKRRKR
jgi:large subunit ribosomal protein L2